MQRRLVRWDENQIEHGNSSSKQWGQQDNRQAQKPHYTTIDRIGNCCFNIYYIQRYYLNFDHFSTSNQPKMSTNAIKLDQLWCQS